MAADLLSAYFQGQTQPFLPLNVCDRQARARAMSKRVVPLSAAVLGVLREQNARLGASAARAAQLDKLADGARVVVTGQQVGLFLGPLFTIYKAATAIQLARTLERETGVAAVPVFWLQTEDHDLPEIARAVVPRTREHAAPLVLEPEIARDNRCSIAQLPLPAAISGSVAALALELESLPRAAQHLERIARHYQPAHTWAQAFAGLLADLFEPEGLLVLDPRDAVLARESAWVHRVALERASEIDDALLARERDLSAAGFAATVHVRPGSPLSFFHLEHCTGPRTRLSRADAGFAEPHGTTHTLSALCATLERDALRFSSSALLRPLVQDALLPTAAYVGGPAEIAYFAQLAPLYPVFGLELSLLAPRARFRLLEPNTRRLLERYGLQASAVVADETRMLAQITPPEANALPAGAELERTLNAGFMRTLEQALPNLPEALLRTLDQQLAKTRGVVATSARKLSEHYERARLQLDERRVNDVRQLQRSLLPEGAPQERIFSLPYFAARYGERSLIERILAVTDPLATTITELPL